MIAIGTLLLLVVKVTLVLSLGLLVTRVAARQAAARRHAIVAATLAAAALATASFAALPRVALVVESRQESLLPLMIGEVATLPDGSAAMPPQRTNISASTALLALWMVGAITCLLPVVRTVRYARRVRREGHVWAAGMDMPVLLHDELASPVVCGVFSPTIVLPSTARGWHPMDVARALLHEQAHLIRQDVLVHAVARTICAVYWFHPLAWMCWHRLRLEAERACDDVVLEHFDAADYASQLVRIARVASVRAERATDDDASRRTVGAHRGDSRPRPLQVAESVKAILVRATALRRRGSLGGLCDADNGS